MKLYLHDIFSGLKQMNLSDVDEIVVNLCTDVLEKCRKFVKLAQIQHEDISKKAFSLGRNYYDKSSKV